MSKIELFFLGASVGVVPMARAIRHTREVLDDECLYPRLLLWSSSLLVESSHELIDVRALSLHAFFFVLGVGLFGQTSTKCLNSPHP